MSDLTKKLHCSALSEYIFRENVLCSRTIDETSSEKYLCPVFVENISRKLFFFFFFKNIWKRSSEKCFYPRIDDEKFNEKFLYSEVVEDVYRKNLRFFFFVQEPLTKDFTRNVSILDQLTKYLAWFFFFFFWIF